MTIAGTPSKHKINRLTNTYSVDFVAPKQLRNSSSSQDRNRTFSVTVRNSFALPDFVVPEQQFLRSVKMPWHEGIRLSVPFAEVSDEGEVLYKMYRGRAVGLSNSSDEWPHSAWEVLEVEWDNDKDGDGDNDRDNDRDRQPQQDQQGSSSSSNGNGNGNAKEDEFSSSR